MEGLVFFICVGGMLFVVALPGMILLSSWLDELLEEVGDEEVI